MDAAGLGLDPSTSAWTSGWIANAHGILAPRVHVHGQMALLVLFAVLSAFLWLLFRAYTVLHTPNDVLVEKLGLDIPPEPTVTLEEIGARHAQISWKLEDSPTSVHEYHVEVNGRPIGVTRKHETAAVISNLSPNTLYELRIFSVSPGRFSTSSRSVHLRTCKLSADAAQDGSSDGNPTVRPLAARLPSVPTLAPAPATQRESLTSTSIARRGTNPRKTSPAGQPEASFDPKDMDEEHGEDLAELSQQFSEINAERDEIEAGILKDAEEYEAAKAEKEAQRQAHLQDVKERDEASNDLKKQVHRAEATSRSLLTEKTKKEKQLKDRENRRQKRINEMAQWDKSVQHMAEEIDAINKQKDALRRRMEDQVQEVRDRIAEEQREIQQIEDDNKEKAQQLRELQEERQRNSVDEETDESREADRRDEQRDYQFRHDVAAMSHRYNQIWQEVQKQQQDYVLYRQRLTMMQAQQKASNAVTFAPMGPADLDMSRRNDRIPRRGRHTSSHGSNVSSPRVAHAPEPFVSAHSAVTNSSPMPSRLVNIVNGMTTIPAPIILGLEDDDDDDDMGFSAPMSPRADALIPTDLLDNDSEDDFAPDEDNTVRNTTQRDSQPLPFPPFVPEPLPPAERESPDSPSPQSASSPRSFASPNEEGYQEVEPDRKSNRSSHPPIPEDIHQEAPTHKRLTSISDLFSFNRARGKTNSGPDQPPLLGALKSESQSFPRKVDEFDPSAQPRRRLSYNNNWTFNGGNFLGKHNDDEPDPVKPSMIRRGFPSLMGLGKSSASRNYDPFAGPSRTNSLDPSGRGGSSSPRPGSTYSFDAMPRMSVEDSFNAWRYDRGPARNSPLVPDWASTYSRSHSRRPSLGFGSQTNLVLNHGDTGEFIEPKRDNRPLQAPIGTRPTSSSQRPSTPKLNPAAPSFNMFKFGKGKEKPVDKDKDKKAKEDANIANSPPESRKSKDTHSIAPTTSTMESRESLERTTSGYSIGGTGSLESTPASKPTLIGKIARKASSNKFDAWKKNPTSIFSSSRNKGEATTPTGEITEDEHMSGSTEQLGRSVESASSTPGAGNTPNPEDKKSGSRTSLGSWNFMRKKQKASNSIRESMDLAASEVSEVSETHSEAGTANGTDHGGDWERASDVDGGSRPTSAANNNTAGTTAATGTA